MLRIAIYLLLASLVCSAKQVDKSAKKPQSTPEKKMFADSEYLPKGGIGIVTREIYIDLKSRKNELILKGDDRWEGEDRVAEQVVFVYQNRVWEPGVMTKGFDLAKAIVISFENDRVRFFDFVTMKGGFYRRENQP